MNLSLMHGFFPGSTRVFALPNWKSPRLIFPADSAQARWANSAFFPAFRLRGRVYRAALRALITVYPKGRTTANDSNTWPLGDFIKNELPDASTATVLMGTPGPAQKITIQLRDASGIVVGYAKYAEKPGARIRLKKEYSVLKALPAGIGPSPLKFGEFQNGDLLVTTPVSGNPVGASIPPSPAIARYAADLVRDDEYSIDAHPSIAHILSVAPKCSKWLATLEGRRWPTTIRHGDFVAWNLREQNGAIVAFDWEYGSLSGFPFLDLAFYCMKTGALIYDYAPQKAFDVTVAYLRNGPLDTVDEAAVETITRLSVLDAFLLARQDGHADTSHLQKWRKALLEDVV